MVCEFVNTIYIIFNRLVLKKKENRQYKKQLNYEKNGNLHIEYIVVLYLTILASIWAVSAWAEKKNELKVEAQIVWMRSVQQAVERYIEEYGHVFQHLEPNQSQLLDQVWIQNWQHPTLNE